jgi:hypothetical protein
MLVFLVLFALGAGALALGAVTVARKDAFAALAAGGAVFLGWGAGRLWSVFHDRGWAG